MPLLHRELDSGPLFNLPEGRRRRDEGISRVEKSGGDAATRWRDSAREWVRERATKPGEFNGDDLRLSIGGPPHSPNAMGGIWIWAKRQGLIHYVGHRPRQCASAHKQMIGVYVGAAFAQEGSS